MSNQPFDPDFNTSLQTVFNHIQTRHNTLNDLPVIPTPSSVHQTISSLPSTLPSEGLGTTATTQYLIETLLPGILQGQNGNRYFGFVVGGVTPAAQLAEILGGSYDENVQTTLEGVTASTAIEQRTLEMVLDLVRIPRDWYLGRTITTGATASNVLGLACARNHLYANSPHLPRGYSYSQSGPPSSSTLPSPPIIVLSLYPHYSILKAAALVGLGSGPNVVQNMPSSPDDELAFDLTALETRLKAEQKIGRGVILSYGFGEVNTGGFGSGLPQVAKLCKDHGAWLHIDAAFGGFAGLAPELTHLTKDMHLADSLTLDGHKWLNVPYDCGLFFTRTQTSLPGIFSPTTSQTPAYLQTSPTIPSPLYINIENSRRFRSLPLLASLLSLGHSGYSSLIQQNLKFARKIATYLNDSPNYQLLNHSTPSSFPSTTEGDRPIIPLNIVLFRGSLISPFSPKEEMGSERLTEAINSTRRIYVTGTKWRGEGAVRLAVSCWRTGGGGDEEFEVVRKVFEEVMEV